MAGCSAWRTRSSCSPRATCRSRRRNAPACSSAASSTRPKAPLVGADQKRMRGLRPCSAASVRAGSAPAATLALGIRREEPNSRLMATLALLADAATKVNTFIDVFLWVYILLIFVYVLTSWVQLPYSIWLRRITDFLRDVCEPYLRIFRRILPPLGPLDLSPVVAMLALIALMRVIDALFAHYT